MRKWKLAKNKCMVYIAIFYLVNNVVVRNWYA